ncbi:hypothetical protein BRPE64_BCDS06180 [Caballeronia insecticola]|uniref:Uncharacterized protein n=1 Tax=Caballeronia insecticola TaxID=758793 RepID=R4WLF3_9BURK|nr:hypothetical protein BRPE64_BCDS06180 [Caballeronia insecticola]
MQCCGHVRLLVDEQCECIVAGGGGADNYAGGKAYPPAGLLLTERRLELSSEDSRYCPTCGSIKAYLIASPSRSVLPPFLRSQAPFAGACSRVHRLSGRRIAACEYGRRHLADYVPVVFLCPFSLIDHRQPAQFLLSVVRQT